MTENARLAVTLTNGSKIEISWDPSAGVTAQLNGQAVGSTITSTASGSTATSPVIATQAGFSGVFEPFDNPQPGALPSVVNVIGVSQTLTKPPAGATVMDPTFKGTIRKLTDGSVHVYSQLQSFSSDGKYVLLVEPDGRYSVKVYDTLVIVASGFWRAPRWIPNTHKLLMLSDTSPVVITTLDVTLGTRETVMTLSQFKSNDKDRSFESLSDDGRWLGLFVSDDGAGNQWVVAVDIINKALGMCKKLSDITAVDPQWGLVWPDWIAPSPKGNYMVVQFKTTDGTGSGLSLYDIKTGAFVRKLYSHHNHSDLGIDLTGREFVATTASAHPMNNNKPALVACYLDDGSVKYIRLVDWVRTEHISCQGPPGRIIVSAGDKYDGPLKGEIYVAYLDGTLRRLVHHRSTSGAYWIEPKASISHDGKRLIWSSDWGIAGSRDCFVIDNLSI